MQKILLGYVVTANQTYTTIQGYDGLRYKAPMNSVSHDVKEVLTQATSPFLVTFEVYENSNVAYSVLLINEIKLAIDSSVRALFRQNLPSQLTFQAENIFHATFALQYYKWQVVLPLERIQMAFSDRTLMHSHP